MLENLTLSPSAALSFLCCGGWLILGGQNCDKCSRISSESWMTSDCSIVEVKRKKRFKFRSEMIQQGHMIVSDFELT